MRLHHRGVARCTPVGILPSCCLYASALQLSARLFCCLPAPLASWLLLRVMTTLPSSRSAVRTCLFHLGFWTLWSTRASTLWHCLPLQSRTQTLWSISLCLLWVALSALTPQRLCSLPMLRLCGGCTICAKLSALGSAPPLLHALLRWPPPSAPFPERR